METKLEVTNLITPFINTYKTINNEWKNLFDIGLSDYLQSQTEKYYFTNTFIHRSEKVVFNEIYYPISASYKKLTTSFKDLKGIFENYKNITIVGSAGSGKTTLLKYIFLNCIETKTKIPILLELRNLNDYNGDFEKMICEKILKSKIKPTDDTFRRSLQKGSFLFLLDGYDEIFSIKKQELNRQIELFVDSYPKNNFIISTRPGSGIENFSRFYDFKVCALGNTDVDGFIHKIVENPERRKRIGDIIKDPKNNNYIEYLRNPLLLSMFIMAFESHPEIPSKKSAFYRNVFDTLYSKHDGITKNSFPREKLTKLQKDEFEKILTVFSYLTLLDRKIAFTEEYLTNALKKVKKVTEYPYKIEDLIYDLQTTISILILDGFEYKFPHRSMQEYFAALFISELTSDEKTLAYKNLLTVLESSSNDFSLHLWNIFRELDESSFLSNFIIPKLKSYEKLLSTTNDEKLVKAYIKLVGPVFYRSETDLVKTMPNGLLIARHQNIYSSITEFCEIYDHMKFCEFALTSNAEKELIIMYPELAKGDMHLDNNYFQKPEVIKILIKHKLPNLIREFKTSISKKILFYEKEHLRKQNNLNKLLNL